MEDRKTRVFFALWPSREAALRLHSMAGEWREICGGRPIRIENLHLTLFFFGAATTAEIARLVDIAAEVRVPPFRLRLDRCSIFSRQKLLWAGSRKTPRPLLTLVAALNAGVQQMRGTLPVVSVPRFLPHVTLLRNISAGNLENSQKMLIEWECRDFMLIQSALTPGGSVYTELGRWPLKEE